MISMTRIYLSIIKILSFMVVLTFSTSNAIAQEKEKWGEGEIEKVEIEIVKEKQISLPAANRNFIKVPPRPAEPIKPEITYDFQNLNFAVNDYNPAIRPLRLQQEPIAKLYNNFISGGFGNYLSPMLQGNFTNKRSKEKFYGLEFFHQSFGTGPVDGKNSASGNTEFSLFGKSFGKYGNVAGRLGVENFSNRFYGYKPDPNIEQSAEKQAYSIVNLAAEVESKDVSDFNFNLLGGFSYLSDKFAASESEVSLNFKSKYNISDEQKIILNSDYFLIARKDELVEAKPRHIFKVKPAYQFTLLDKLILTAGVNVVLQNDTIGNRNAFQFYPDVKASYEISNSFELYGALTGDIDKVSLHTMAHENPWLDANVGIFSTNRNMELLGGVRGKLMNKVGFATGFSIANLKDLYFYRNNPTDRSKFIVEYDEGNTQRTNFFGELSFDQQAKVRLMLRGDLYAYSTDKVEAAWHRPTYRVTLNSGFTVVDKFLINVDLISQGGIKAYDIETSSIVTLPSALELNLKLNYFVSQQFSVFLKGNNLLGSNYQVYQYYQVRGLQVLGGLSYMF
jgi:hypothetical protein